MDAKPLTRANLFPRAAGLARRGLIAGIVVLMAVRANAADPAQSSVPTDWLVPPVLMSLDSLGSASTQSVSDSSSPTQQWITTPADTADLERRIRELEAIVRQIEAEKSGTSPAAEPDAPTISQTMQSTAVEQTEPAAGGMGLGLPPSPQPIFNPIGSEGNAPQSFSQALPPGFAGWRDGFYIISPDEAFSLRITGQIQVDYRLFANTEDRKDIDTFLLRRARFGLEATLFKYYEFRFLPDFGESSDKTAPTPVIQDCYLNIHYCNEIQFEFGRFKQPISYEQLIQDRFIPTLERSIIDQLVPGRDIGLMIHGEKLFDNRLDYGVSVSNGETNGFGDTNDGKDVNGRVAIRPLNDPDLPDWMRYFQVGISGSTGVEQESVAPASLITPDTVTWFTFSSTTLADGVRWRAVPEMAYFVGPLGMYAEYLLMDQQMEQLGDKAKNLPLNEQNVPFNGWVVLTSLLLTGETRTTYSEALKPLHPFDPRNLCTGTGAWDILFRVSQLGVGDQVFATTNPLAAKGQPNEATEFTVGFNWYMNEWVRMQFNWEHDVFSVPVALGAAPLRDQDSLFTRFQIQF
jgi:phosphate-selective porin OprO and OprP